MLVKGLGKEGSVSIHDGLRELTNTLPALKGCMVPCNSLQNGLVSSDQNLQPLALLRLRDCARPVPGHNLGLCLKIIAKESEQ